MKKFIINHLNHKFIKIKIFWLVKEMGCNVTSIYGDEVIGKIFYPD